MTRRDSKIQKNKSRNLGRVVIASSLSNKAHIRRKRMIFVLFWILRQVILDAFFGQQYFCKFFDCLFFVELSVLFQFFRALPNCKTFCMIFRHCSHVKINLNELSKFISTQKIQWIIFNVSNNYVVLCSRLSHVVYFGLKNIREGRLAYIV